jgi:PAS domain S-box-containing protein
MQWALSGAVVLYVASTVPGVRNHSGYDVILDGWLRTGILTCASLLLAWRVVVSPRDRSAWACIAAGFALFNAGQLVWLLYVQYQAHPPVPSAADLCWLASYGFFYVGVIKLARQRTAGSSRLLRIDSLIIALGLAAFAMTWLGKALDGTSGQFTLVLTTMAYPVGDLLLLVLIIGSLALQGWRTDRVWAYLGLGLALFAAGDTVYVLQVANGTYVPGTLLDPTWEVAAVFIVVAAWRPHARIVTSRTMGWAVVVVPTLFIVAAVGLLATRHDGGPNPVTILAVATVLAGLGRAAFTFKEMQTLLADNIRLTSDLEDRVQQRTHELEQLTRRHMSILDGAGEGIVGLDRSGLLTFANPAAAALLGRARDELVGRSFHQLTQPRDADGELTSALLDPIAASLADGQSRSVADGTYRRADGMDFSVELTVGPVHSGEDVSGAVLMFRDVTERRAIDRMKDEFVSVVSHELRTPLTSLRGALGLLQGGLLTEATPKAQRMVHIAVESTDRLIRLINDILDVERIAAGKLALHRQAWPAANLVGRAVAEMRGLASQAGVHLEVRAAGGTVDADADRIVQTLANLLSNAIKFSPEQGTVRVTVAERGSEVMVSVSDEGSGIPLDHHESVFGRFAQVDASDTRANEGSGLGLAICRGIVEQHGGRIWVDSEPGAGATFSFTLPVVDSSAEPETSPDDDRSVPTVLVCEDDSSTRAVITELLRSHGYRVVGAASGEEALTLARQHVPDAVLMDLTLPGLDGWAAISALGADERTRDVPVVIVSGTAPGPAPVDVQVWLTKSLDVVGLLAALGDAIGESGPRPCVLVVEDDPALAKVLVALFAEHGVIAVHASTARDARRLSHDIAPDLLLLDLLLPDSDGFALVDWLREDPRLCRVPLVVYSALDLDDDEKQRLRLGPTEFFTKTKTNPEEVERQVLALLDTVVAGAIR